MTSSSRARLLAVALPLAVAPATAQTPSEILGLTDSAPLLARIDPTCTLTTCAPAVGPAPFAWAGGVAHDPADRATWLSDGLTLTKVDARTGCATVCAPFPAPNLAPGAVVTGLAFNESLRLLFVSHSNNQIFVYQTSTCALTLLSSCTLTVPPNHIVSALATDDPAGLLYYASSPWLGPGAPTEIHTALQTAPCVPVCPALIPSNSAGIVPDVTGLAYDACRQLLAFTDGLQVYELLNTGPCSFVPANICPGVPGQLLTGLCVLPSTETTSGPSCASGTAPNCTTMQHTLRGDPTVGNLTFALELVNQPTPSLAMCFLDFGPSCGAANFGLCSPLPSIPIWGSLQFVGGTGCTGFASFALPLPPTAALCGIVLSSRWAGWMVPGGLADHFVSDCQTWAISGS